MTQKYDILVTILNSKDVHKFDKFKTQRQRIPHTGKMGKYFFVVERVKATERDKLEKEVRKIAPCVITIFEIHNFHFSF